MNNIKLSINTGIKDTDIIDLGLYNPSLNAIMGLAVPDPKGKYGFVEYIAFMTGGELSPLIQSGLTDIDSNSDKYGVFKTGDLLAARDYLNKLKIACDTYPACMVKIETL